MSLLKRHLKQLPKTLMHFGVRFMLMSVINSVNDAEKQRKKKYRHLYGVDLCSMESIFRAIERGEL